MVRTMRAVRTGRRNAPAALCTMMLPAVLLLGGCSLDGALKSELPPDVADPTLTLTADGARAMYRGTLVQLRAAFAGSVSSVLGPGGLVNGSFVRVTGNFTDELEPGVGGVYTEVDRRQLSNQGLPTTMGSVYSTLQRLRGQAGQTTELLGRYLSEEPALASHIYAVKGYAEIFLAELFCSGIPLSTLGFDGDYTYRPGSTTREVFEHALALFDTARTLGSDSTRFVNLARVGQGRALLGLGQYAAAAAVTAEVPDLFSYAVQYAVATTNAIAPPTNFATSGPGTAVWGFSVADGEGINGLNYRTSADPRTAFATQNGPVGSGRTVSVPRKYATNGSSPVVLASGIEARLIEAEAALWTGDTDTWLAKLNHLRQTAYGTIMNCAAATCTAHASPLPDLTDPGAALADPAAAQAARVDLLFRERAFWLYLTGHRQGDLRRLVRSVDAGGYGRPQDQVYPTGPFPDGGIYGADVTAPVPLAEQTLNTLYTGCVSNNA